MNVYLFRQKLRGLFLIHNSYLIDLIETFYLLFNIFIL
jgi:hypothetical protein